MSEQWLIAPVTVAREKLKRKIEPYSELARQRNPGYAGKKTKRAIAGGLCLETNNERIRATQVNR